MKTEKGTLDFVVNKFIDKALKKFEGNRTHAAKYLGISERTLRNKIKSKKILKKWKYKRKDDHEVIKELRPKDAMGRYYRYWI